MTRLAGLLLFAAGLLASANRVVLAQRAEPRSFNPVTAFDVPTRDVLRLIHGRLVRINGVTLATEASLARSWKLTPDGRSCTVELRRGVRFSDGQPFDADDVLFSFEVYLDPKLGSAQRDLLSPNGQPVQVSKLSSHTIRVEFKEPYAPGVRLFDGLAILPRHLLDKPYREGKLAQAWTVGTPPAQIAGLGPFALAQHVPGQRLILRRNPYYWEAGKPKLDEVEIAFTPDQTAEVLRFRQGEIDLIQRPPAKAFAALDSTFTKLDVGPSLEYHHLFFNLNGAAGQVPEAIRAKQDWFRREPFRRAISLAADRAAMTKLAFDGRATPLAHHVTPGNKAWLVEGRSPQRSLEEAKKLLADAGLAGRSLEFSLLVNAANTAQAQLATILQEDLRGLGIRLRIVPLDFRSLVDRVTKSLDYEAALMGFGSGDADPNSEMNIWLSRGAMHIWNLSAEKNPLPWEREIDRWMLQQRSTLNPSERKRAYGEVQKLVAQHLPIIALVSPHLLVAHKAALKGVRPGITPPFSLWNIEEWHWGSR